MSTATATRNGPASEVAGAGRVRVQSGRVEHFTREERAARGKAAFTFNRGAAALMAADLADAPRTGLEVQLCGDAHLSNFGAFAAPDRRLIFGVNDFDESLPGPFEWDVKRLVASFAIAGRDRGFSWTQRKQVNLAVARSYREAMRDFYIRQLWDGKGSALVEAMDPSAMAEYAHVCGWTLARHTPAPATPRKSPATSGPVTRSTARWRCSPRATPTRTTPTTPRSGTLSMPGRSLSKRACR